MNNHHTPLALLTAFFASPALAAGPAEFLSSLRSAEARVIITPNGSDEVIETSDNFGVFTPTASATFPTGGTITSSISSVSRFGVDRIRSDHSVVHQGGVTPNGNVFRRARWFSTIDFRLDSGTEAVFRLDPVNIIYADQGFEADPISTGRARIIDLTSGTALMDWNLNDRNPLTWSDTLGSGDYRFEIEFKSSTSYDLEFENGWSLTLPSPGTAAVAGLGLVGTLRRRRS